MSSLVRDDLEDAMQKAREMRDEHQLEAYVRIVNDDFEADVVYRTIQPFIDKEKDLATVYNKGQVYVKAFKI